MSQDFNFTIKVGGGCPQRIESLEVTSGSQQESLSTESMSPFESAKQFVGELATRIRFPDKLAVIVAGDSRQNTANGLPPVICGESANDVMDKAMPALLAAEMLGLMQTKPVIYEGKRAVPHAKRLLRAYLGYLVTSAELTQSEIKEIEQLARVNQRSGDGK